MNRLLLEVALALMLAFAITGFLKSTGACAGETPIYGPDGKYQGSVFNYGKTQTYTDRSGQFSGSAINNGNGTTSFYGPRGNFSGSAGSSINDKFNFKK